MKTRKLINFKSSLKASHSVFLLIGIAMASAWLLLFIGCEITEGISGEKTWIVLDEKIFAMIIAMRSDFLTDTMMSLTYLGSTFSTTLIVICTALFFHFKELNSERRIILFTAFGCLLSIRLLKFFFDRSRPSTSFWLTHATGYSFPSGHSAGSFAIYGALFFLIGRSCNKIHQRIILWVVGSLVIFSIGFSRIYLGVHYPIDVLGGFLLGSTLLFFAITCDKYVKLNKIYFWRRRDI